MYFNFFHYFCWILDIKLSAEYPAVEILFSNVYLFLLKPADFLKFSAESTDATW